MEKAPRKQSFLEGAVILMAGTLLVKLISMLFKIPILRMLGGRGNSYFGAAYTVFTFLSTVATAGFPVAIAKMVSESSAAGRYRDIRRTLGISRLFFWVTGLVCMGVMAAGAGFYAREVLHIPGAQLAILCLSPAVLACCLLSSYRGYYQGLRNMYPTAVSQVIEAAVKLLLGLLLTYLTLEYTRQEYAQHGTVLGRAYATQSGAEQVISQLGAAAAVLGVAASSMAGAVYLRLRHRLAGDGITKELLAQSPQPSSRRELLGRLTRLAAPICLGSLTVSLTANIDLATLTGRLAHLARTAPQALYDQYGAVLTGLEAQQLPSYFYGIYTMAETVANLVPSLTACFAVSALPAVSDAWARKSRLLMERNVEAVLRVTALICIPCGLGIAALAGPLCLLFYGSGQADAMAIAAPLLSVLGVASIFVALTTSLNSLQQAIGRVTAPVKLIALGSGVKFAVNHLLIGVPRVNIRAAPVATLCCYLLVTAASMALLSRYTGLSYRYGSILGKPALAGLGCAVAARGAYRGLSALWPSAYAVLPAVAVGAAVYLAGVLLLGALEQEDLAMLPGGEKLAKILETYSLLG